MSDKNIAKYGSYLIKELSRQLTVEFGKGFSKINLHQMVKFYLSFPIVQTLSAQLTWSHSEEELKAEIEKDIFELGLMVEDDE